MSKDALSLSWFWKLTKEHRLGFGIITSWRSGLTDVQNADTFKVLKQEIKSVGYGFLWLVGIWKSQNSDKEETESVLFIPNLQNQQYAIQLPLGSTDLRALLINLCMKYNQNAIYSTGDQARLLDKKGETIESVNQWKPTDIHKLWSSRKRLLDKNRSFYLVGNDGPQSWMGAHVRAASGEIFPSSFERFLKTGTTVMKDTPENRQKQRDQVEQSRKADRERRIREADERNRIAQRKKNTDRIKVLAAIGRKQRKKEKKR